jgi:hypothetical protein
MTKLEFSFGMDLDTNGITLTREQKSLGLAQVRDAALSAFGGCTVMHGHGDWRDEDTGRTYSEKSVVLSVLIPFVSEHSVLVLVDTIKRSLSQKAVLVTRLDVLAQIY